MQVVYQQTILLENSCSTARDACLKARIMQSDFGESFKMPNLLYPGSLKKLRLGISKLIKANVGCVCDWPLGWISYRRSQDQQIPDKQIQDKQIQEHHIQISESKQVNFNNINESGRQ